MARTSGISPASSVATTATTSGSSADDNLRKFGYGIVIREVMTAAMKSKNSDKETDAMVGAMAASLIAGVDLNGKA